MSVRLLAVAAQVRTEYFVALRQEIEPAPGAADLVGEVSHGHFQSPDLEGAGSPGLNPTTGGQPRRFVSRVTCR